MFNFLADYAQIGISSCLGSFVDNEYSRPPKRYAVGEIHRIRKKQQGNDRNAKLEEPNKFNTTSSLQGNSKPENCDFVYVLKPSSTSNSTLTSTTASATTASKPAFHLVVASVKEISSMVIPGPFNRQPSSKTRTLSRLRNSRRRRHYRCNDDHDNNNVLLRTKIQKKEFHKSQPNQLIEAVSPFDEVCNRSSSPPLLHHHVQEQPTSMAFRDDEMREPDPFASCHSIRPHEAKLHQAQPRSTLDCFYSQVLSTPRLYEIPMEVWIPSSDSDAASEVSMEDLHAKQVATRSCDERTLTPHPSFDEDHQAPTERDFSHLYQASLQLEERDTNISIDSPNWPSDEDKPNITGLFGACNSFQFWTGRSGPERGRFTGGRRRANFLGSTQDVMNIMKNDQVKPFKKYPVVAKSKYRMV